MPIAKSHSDPDPKKRVGKSHKSTRGPFSTKKMYQRTEAILDEIYCDIANGMMDSEIKKKLMSGLYTAQDGKTMKERTTLDYLTAVRDRIAADYREKVKAVRENLLLNYMTIYQDALKSSDRYNAKGALDSIAKLTGANQDKPTTAVQINSTNESGITINFGFLSDNKDEEKNDEC